MQPSSARLFRVILPVTSIEHGTRFYSALLDSPGMRISEGRHYFNCGGVILAVYDSLGDGDREPVRPNPEHIYFAVPDIHSVFARAQQLGGLSTETGDGGLPMGDVVRRPWGEVSFYLDDPFGNPLCFVDEASVYRGPTSA